MSALHAHDLLRCARQSATLVGDVNFASCSRFTPCAQWEPIVAKFLNTPNTLRTANDIVSMTVSLCDRLQSHSATSSPLWVAPTSVPRHAPSLGGV